MLYRKGRTHRLTQEGVDGVTVLLNVGCEQALCGRVGKSDVGVGEEDGRASSDLLCSSVGERAPWLPFSAWGSSCQCQEGRDGSKELHGSDCRVCLFFCGF